MILDEVVFEDIEIGLERLNHDSLVLTGRCELKFFNRIFFIKQTLILRKSNPPLVYLFDKMSKTKTIFKTDYY